MLRAIQRTCARLQARRQAEASAKCRRIIQSHANPARRAVLLYAAARCPDPVRQARLLSDLSDAFHYANGV